MTTDKQRLAQAREILEWYAKEKNYWCIMKYAACGHNIDWPNTPVLQDEGAKARVWLAHDDETNDDT